LEALADSLVLSEFAKLGAQPASLALKSILYMRILLLITLFTPLITFSQYSTEYEYKCQFSRSLFKTTCEQLDLHQDSTYMTLKSELRELYSVTNGRYFIKNDTITTIDDEINYLKNFNCRSSLRQFYEISFRNTYGNCVKLDSVKIYSKDQSPKTFRKTNKVEFIEADSLLYFLQDSSYYLPLDLTTEQKLKDIVLNFQFGISNLLAIIKFFAWILKESSKGGLINPSPSERVCKAFVIISPCRHTVGIF